MAGDPGAFVGYSLAHRKARSKSEDRARPRAPDVPGGPFSPSCVFWSVFARSVGLSASISVCRSSFLSCTTRFLCRRVCSGSLDARAVSSEPQEFLRAGTYCVHAHVPSIRCDVRCRLCDLCVVDADPCRSLPCGLHSAVPPQLASPQRCVQGAMLRGSSREESWLTGSSRLRVQAQGGFPLTCLFFHGTALCWQLLPVGC